MCLAKLSTPPVPGQTVEERSGDGEWAGQLSCPALDRLWQLLLKGHDEVARASLPIEAAEMALLRVIHASSPPDPGELARRVASGEGPMPGNPASAPPPTSAVPPSPDASAGLPADFAGVISLLDADGQIALAEKLKISARLIRYDPPDIEIGRAHV